MQKVIQEDGQSANIIDENIAQLKALFPDAYTESGVNFEILQQLLGAAKVLDEGEEKYGLNWHGKKKARQIALTPSTGTLLPCPEESVDWDNTQNLFIEGDNLETLKLLQKSYAGEVKLIYIDPPYNTGKEFVYPDNYQDNLETYLKYTGQIDSDGLKFSSNTETGGRKHTNWLNMMLPRLRLAKSLLKKDGAIFASCDENEQSRLRALMDEVFGEENFVADMVWAAGRKNDSKLVSISHEYIVCYARDANFLKENNILWRQRKKGLDDIYAQYNKLKSQYGENYLEMTKGLRAWYKALPDGHAAKAHKHYKCIDKRGVYFPADISWPGGGGPKYEVLHPVTKKPVKVPQRGWMTANQDNMQGWIADERVHFGEDENSVPCIKAYLEDQEYQAPYSVFYQDGRAATKRLRELMGGDVFDFPKDETVLQEVVEMITSDEDIVLDFFAGSGTTAHSVFLQNQKDGGRRRYILVQLPEALDAEKKEQEESATLCESLGIPLNIASLAQERIRRAAARIRSSDPEFTGDTGFRLFRLSSSNLIAWNPDRSDMEATLLSHKDHLIEGRSEQDVLYELLLKRGIKLTVPIEEKSIAGKAIFSIGFGVLFTCLAASIMTEEVDAVAQGIIAWHKELKPETDTHVFFRDSAFADDIAKTNMAAILEQNGISHVRSL